LVPERRCLLLDLRVPEAVLVDLRVARDSAIFHVG
jgi:hypothetical protein